MWILGTLGFLSAASRDKEFENRGVKVAIIPDLKWLESRVQQSSVSKIFVTQCLKCSQPYRIQGDEHWQAWCLPHSPGSWGFCWMGLFPKYAWFCLKTKPNKPKVCFQTCLILPKDQTKQAKNPAWCPVRAACPESWRVDWWEWLLLISQYSPVNIFTYTRLWV